MSATTYHLQASMYLNGLKSPKLGVGYHRFSLSWLYQIVIDNFILTSKSF